MSTGELEIRPYRSGDLDEVYALHLASEDPSHLNILGLSKSQLRTPFWMRLARFATQRRFIAARAGKIVGSVVTSHTTQKEAGRISSLEVRPEDRIGGIQRALADAAIGEIRRASVDRIIATVPFTRPDVMETFEALGYTETMVLVGMSKELR